MLIFIIVATDFVIIFVFMNLLFPILFEDVPSYFSKLRNDHLLKQVFRNDEKHSIWKMEQHYTI